MSDMELPESDSEQPIEPGTYWTVVPGTSRARKQSQRAQDAENAQKPDAALQKRRERDDDYINEEGEESDASSDSGEAEEGQEVEPIGAEVCSNVRDTFRGRA